MQLIWTRTFLLRPLVTGLWFLTVLPGRVAAEPSAEALAHSLTYIQAVEARLTQQHHAAGGFVAAVGPAPQTDARLRGGELLVEKLTPADGPSLPGAMVHHWRATAFAAGATAADLERLLRGVPAYPRIYAPQVLQARVLGQVGDHLRTTMRVRQKHVLTVVLDTDYDVSFGRLDARHGYSFSRSTRVAEIAGVGTASEHALTAAQEHGFLWRQNTYWSYEERDGGLYLQIESISLTRSVPTGLGWAVRPFIESVPRESLEFTLRSTVNALRK